MDGASITGLYQEFLIPSITLFQINVISAMPPALTATAGNIWSCYVSYGYVSYACITVCAVAQHCCKGDEHFQWEMPFFRVFQLRNPWTDFQKILHSWLRRWPHLTCKNLDQSAHGGRVCACVKLSSSGVYFFSFLVSCSSLQIHPLDE